MSILTLYFSPEILNHSIHLYFQIVFMHKKSKWLQNYTWNLVDHILCYRRWVYWLIMEFHLKYDVFNFNTIMLQSMMLFMLLKILYSSTSLIEWWWRKNITGTTIAMNFVQTDMQCISTVLFTNITYWFLISIQTMTVSLNR